MMKAAFMFPELTSFSTISTIPLLRGLPAPTIRFLARTGFRRALLSRGKQKILESPGRATSSLGLSFPIWNLEDG